MAFLTLGIHRPNPESVDDLLASQRRLAAAIGDAPGLIRIGSWVDERAGVVVGMSLWESRESFQAGWQRGAAELAEIPFEEWEPEPHEVLLLEEATAVRA